MKVKKQCGFILAYMDDCGKPADKTGFCDKHKNLKCCGCGEQATRECEAGASMACGAPLCDTCVHLFSGHHGKPKNELER